MKIRSASHRRFISQQPCIISGRRGDDIHAHHLMEIWLKGVGRKASDIWCIPLHYTIHDALHKNGNEVAFFANHGLEYEQVKAIAMQFAGNSPDARIRNNI